MVQIIESNKKPSFGQSLMKGVSQSAPDALGRYFDRQREESLRDTENTALEKQGYNLKGVRSPDARKALLEGQGEDKRQSRISGLLGSTQQGQQPNNEETGLGQNKQNFDAANISDASIAQIETMDGPFGSRLRQLKNDAIKRRDEADKKSAEQNESKEIYLEAGKSPEDAERLSKTTSPTTARSILATIKQQPVFEAESDKLLAKQQAEFRNEAVQGYKAALDSEPRLKEMVDRAKSGKLSTPLMIKTLDTLGIPLSVLGNPENEAYRKFEYDWLKDAQNYFPGQVRTFEAQSFLKSIPGLMVSDEGKLTVANYLKATNDAKKLVYDTVKKVIKDNNGKTPNDLDFQVYERVSDQLSKLGQEAKSAVDEAEKIGPKLTMYDAEGNQYNIPSMNSAAIEQAVNQGFKFSK